MPAGSWPSAQGEFKRSFESDAPDLPAMEVRYRWWTVVDYAPVLGGWVGALIWMAVSLFRLGQRARKQPSGLPVGTHVWIYPPDAASDTEPLLVFETRLDFVEAHEPRGSAALLGDARPNGTLVLFAQGVAVWPTYNPRLPYPGSPRWGEDLPA